MSVVEPASCASYAWVGLSVTVTFAGCTLEATGESVEGSLGLAVSYFPTTFTVTFTSLTVGDTQVDGALALNVGGACGGMDLGCMPCMDSDATCAEMRENQQTLTGSLTVRSGGTTVLEIAELALTSSATGITASGSFVIDGQSATATDLHWATGECLPSSGSVALGGATITFLATTPADGSVEVRVGSFPAVTQMLFEPCAAP